MGFLRGSTPTHTWNNLEVNLKDARVYATYSQSGKVIVDKTNEDMTITEDSITVRLAQEDTLKFKVGVVEIQFRYVFEDGTSGGSRIFKTNAEKILKEGVIVWP